MYKHVACLVRKEGTSHGEFVDYWQTHHTPIARDIEGVVRYHTVVPTDPEHSEFDGVAELYFESLDDLHDALGSPGSRDYDPTKAVAAKAREDVDEFLAIDERPRFIGEEVVQKDAVGGDTNGLYKHSAFLVRKEGLTHEEFRDYWETQHTPLARDIEGVVRYHTVYPTDPENAEFDGVAELYFETLEDLHDALGSPGSRDYDPTKAVAAKAREDVDEFLAIDERPRFIGRETVRKDATEGVEGY
ncbi:EthD domain-containing protein [Salinilacihabitans rarus]|uniref:EthD domain-containing protein n=1 Tax=Salinilacihabitans rarus TaxID=2961596 RepID=UPI0020C92A04|nr:EthD domain-containing protein [Salinilacihabitans rarus]